jgi:L-fucose mutarotase
VLKGISPILSPDLLAVLMQMGHGDDLVIADGNFPAEGVGQRVIRADGHGVMPLLQAILQLLPIDTFVDDPAVVMQPVKRRTPEPPIWTSFRAALQHAEGRPIPLVPIERPELYTRARQAFAVVATGETAVYANLMLKKGVVLPR